MLWNGSSTSKLVVFCHTLSPMSAGSWLLWSLFLYRIHLWFKDSITNHNHRSKISYQLLMIEFTQSKTLIPESYTLCWINDGTLDNKCLWMWKGFISPKTATRPQVKICALQQQDVISLCSRQITVLLLAVVFINSQPWLLVLNIFIFFCLFSRQIHPEANK